VVLDLEMESDPIQGLISSSERCPQPFHGWLELGQVLEALRRAGYECDAAAVGPGLGNA
jgi:hypothetical protein